MSYSVQKEILKQKNFWIKGKMCQIKITEQILWFHPKNMMFSVSFLKERYRLECAVSVMVITNGNGQ